MLRADPLRESGRGRGSTRNAARVLARENALCSEGEVRGWRFPDSSPGKEARREARGLED